jgi:subtilisin family serine protease
MKNHIPQTMKSKILFAILIVCGVALLPFQSFGSTNPNIVSDFLGSMQVSETLSGKIKDGKVLRFPTEETEENPDVPQENDILSFSREKILIKYKKDAIDLQSSLGESYANAFVLQKSEEMAPIILESLDSQGKLDEYKTQGGDIQFLQEDFLRVEENIDIANIAVVSVSTPQAISMIFEKLEKDPSVEYVQPNFQYHPFDLNFEKSIAPIDTNQTLSDVIDDDAANNLWSLEDGPGEGSGHSNFDIDILKAWQHLQQTTGDDTEDITVAVIDTGVNIKHPDLQDVLWDSNGYCEYPDGQVGTCNNHGAVFDGHRNSHSFTSLQGDESLKGSDPL